MTSWLLMLFVILRPLYLPKLYWHHGVLNSALLPRKIFTVQYVNAEFQASLRIHLEMQAEAWKSVSLTLLVNFVKH